MSYSRAEIDFVRELTQALEERGKDVWVDWEDIPKTSEWWGRIERGIESARAFIVVVSPDFAASEACRSEVEYAIEHRKHLIPVVRRDVPPAQLHGGVSTRNWIFMRAGDSFEDGLGEVLAAVDTDLEWLDEHARLLVRAREWTEADRDASFLLRGRDLREADQWLSVQGVHGLGATPLESEYIQSSKRSATRRQRTALGSVAVALVVSLILAALAAWQWRRAVDQRDQATTQAKIAESRALVAKSLTALRVAPDLAALLSIEAARQVRDLSGDARYESRNQMLVALQRMPRLVGVIHTSALDLALADGGRRLATAGADGFVRLWDLPQRRLLARLRVSRKGLSVQAIAFSPDGRNLAAESWGTVHFWDARHGTDLRRRLEGTAQEDSPTAIAYTPHGHRLVWAGEDGVLRLWDVRSRRVVPPNFRPVRTAVLSVAVSPDGRLIATGGVQGTRIFDAGTARVRVGPTRGAKGSIATAVAFDPGGDTLATAYIDGKIRLWNVSRGTPRGNPMSADTSVVRDISFSPDGQTIAAGGNNGKVHLWDADTRKQIVTLDAGSSPIVSLAYADQSTLVTAQDNDTVRIWNVRRDGPPGEPLLGRGSRVSGVAYSRDGRTLATAEVDGTIQLWDTPTLHPIGPVLHATSRVRSIALTTRNRLASGGADGDLRVWNLARTPPTSIRLRGSSRTVVAVALSPDGNVLASAEEEGPMRLWDLTRSPPVGRVLAGADWSEAAAFSEDGSRLATAGSALRIWDAVSGTPIGKPFPLGPDGANSVAFSPDGRMIATTNNVGVRLWNVAKSEPSGPPLPGSIQMQLVRFSADGATVVALGALGSLQLWDIATRRRLAEPLRGPSTEQGIVAARPALAVSPDSGTLASNWVQSGGEVNHQVQVRIWGGVLVSSNFTRWRAYLCGIVRRSMTHAEWDKALPGVPYRRTCPAFGPPPPPTDPLAGS